MDEQLDNDLSNRIREVFDNFEDQSYPSADEGWLLLREKFPETEKKRPVAWLWWASAAAVILLFIGIGVWITSEKQQSETLAIKPAKQQEQTTITIDSSKLLATKQTPAVKTIPVAATTAPIIDTAATAKYAAKTQSAKLSQSASAAVAGNSTLPIQQTANNTLTVAKKADSVKTIIAKTNTQQIAVIAPVITGSNTKAPAASQNVKPTSGEQPAVIAKTNTQQLAVTPTTGTNALTPPNKNTTVTPSSSAVSQQPVKAPKQTPPANSMAALFASESANSKKNSVQYTDDKKVRFGVYAATFFNYAKGSSNQVNAGAGFTSEIKLSHNIKLSTGVALAQNTLSYNGAPPSPGPSASDALARGLSASYTNNKENLFALNADQIYPVLKNYNANLIGLDIPLNIKYEFNPQKSDTYISAGLSSGTFINEAYTKVYGLASASGEVNNTTTDDVSRKSFNGFYFARTLNVSFGVGYPIGKSNKLIIEPFLKYPLDGLGAQQLRFGAGGLNLKFNFTNKK